MDRDLMINVTEFRPTELGDLPAEWEVARLGEVAAVKYGRANPKKSGHIPVVGSGGIFDWTDEPLTDFPTLVVGRKGTAGQVQLFKQPCWPSDTTFFLDWKAEIDLDFLYGFMSLHPLSGDEAKTTLPSLKRPDLENYPIPLPPLDEQRKIAHVLNTAQQAIAAQDDLIAAAQEVKRSLMRRLFTYGSGPEPAPTKETEIGEVPEHWGAAILKEVCNKIVDCPHTTPKYRDSGVLVARNFNIRDGRLDLSRPSYTSEEEYEERIKRTVPSEGDVIFSREAPIGEACLIPPKTRLSLGQRTMLLRTNSEELHNAFLVYSIYSDGIQYEMRSRATGVTAKHLNVADVRSLEIPLPSLAEQRQIAHILQTADAKIAAEQDRQAALRELFNSLLQALMTGKLRV